MHSIVHLVMVVVLAVALQSVAFAQAAEPAGATLEQYKDIVIPAKAPPVVKKAAVDLQYHLKKMTGREFPLVEGKAGGDGLHFFVGQGTVPDQDAEIAKLPKEGWMIRTVPGGLLLAGNEEALPVTYYHAVSVFLEKHCGVRWVWPGELGEVIPNNPKLAVPVINESGAPELKRRKLDYYYARYWNDQTKADLQVFNARTRLGDQFRASFGHAWGAVIPADTYFKDHPEWFGLVDGKRVPLQLCVSNPQLRDEFLKRLLSLPGNQKLDIISVSASDGYGFCECDVCKSKGTNETDYKNGAYWDFVNDIAARVKKLRPELKIGSFAYTESRNPPAKIEKLSDNIVLSMTTYPTDLFVPSKSEDYKDFVNKWKSKQVPLIVRGYWGMHYYMDLPVIYPREIATSFKLAREAGMIGAYGETGKNYSTQAPNYYVLNHMLWDPTANPEDILNDFYGTFGKAGPSVRAYFDLMENTLRATWQEKKFVGGFTELVTNYGNIFTPELMAKARTHLDAAMKAAEGDEALKSRVAFLQVGCEYTALMGELFKVYDNLGRTGFPLETFEWNASVGPKRLATRTSNMNENRDFFEKRLAEPFPYTLEQRDAWLVRAWDLGQKRIEMLNKHRSTFALDEGLLASTLEQKYPRAPVQGIRRWHQTVAQFLGKGEEEMAVLEYTHPKKKEEAAAH